MLLLLIPALEMVFALRGTGAQSVTQPDGHITVSEGARLELRCNYSSSVSTYLFWYVQYPSQGLQLLLKYTSGNNLVSGIKGFEAEFRRGGTRAQTVTQPEDHISVFEGSPVQVKCNYSYSGSPELFWYVQYPKQHLQLLLKYTSRESIRGFTADLNKGEASFHLKKPSAQEEDSAVYYCALRDTVTGFTKEAEHKPLKSY
eukprot:bmy_22614T0